MPKKIYLDNEIVLLILKKYSEGISGTKIAKELNLLPRKVYDILRENGIKISNTVISRQEKYKPKIKNIIVDNKPTEDFYVYLHKTLNGAIFYVGKGRKSRYKSLNGRNPKWHEKAKDGYFSEFYAQNLKETDALNIEKDLIKSLPNLVNGSICNRAPNDNNLKEYFKVDPSSKSGLVRIKQTSMSGSYEQGLLGDAGTISNSGSNKYWNLSFNRKSHPVHRIIWELSNGNIPDTYIIDHIDGNGLNNSIDNLRAIPKALNSKNKVLYKNNTTGAKGITLDKTRYVAAIDFNHQRLSKSFTLSIYGKEEALRLAIEWRITKLKELNEQGAGYTDRHMNQGQ